MQNIKSSVPSFEQETWYLAHTPREQAQAWLLSNANAHCFCLRVVQDGRLCLTVRSNDGHFTHSLVDVDAKGYSVQRQTNRVFAPDVYALLHQLHLPLPMPAFFTSLHIPSSAANPLNRRSGPEALGSHGTVGRQARRGLARTSKEADLSAAMRRERRKSWGVGMPLAGTAPLPGLSSSANVSRALSPPPQHALSPPRHLGFSPPRTFNHPPQRAFSPPPQRAFSPPPHSPHSPTAVRAPQNDQYRSAGLALRQGLTHAQAQQKEQQQRLQQQQQQQRFVERDQRLTQSEQLPESGGAYVDLPKSPLPSDEYVSFLTLAPQPGRGRGCGRGRGVMRGGIAGRMPVPHGGAGGMPAQHSGTMPGQDARDQLANMLRGGGAPKPTFSGPINPSVRKPTRAPPAVLMPAGGEYVDASAVFRNLQESDGQYVDAGLALQNAKTPPDLQLEEADGEYVDPGKALDNLGAVPRPPQLYEQADESYVDPGQALDNLGAVPRSPMPFYGHETYVDAGVAVGNMHAGPKQQHQQHSNYQTRQVQQGRTAAEEELYVDPSAVLRNRR